MSRTSRVLIFCAFVLIVKCVIGQTPPSLDRCPDGFIGHAESCYKFHHGHFSWPEALVFCKAFNSHLVTVGSDSELNYIQQRAKEIEGSLALDGFWMAASDAIVQGEWILVTTGQRMTYKNWGPGEPNNIVEHDCAGLSKSENYLFSDFPCSKLLHPICEVELTVGDPSPIG